MRHVVCIGSREKGRTADLIREWSKAELATQGRFRGISRRKTCHYPQVREMI